MRQPCPAHASHSAARRAAHPSEQLVHGGLPSAGCSTLVFRLLPNGFLNRNLRGLLAGAPRRGPGQISASQVSYGLCRLRSHGLTARGTRSDTALRVSGIGLHHAMLITTCRPAFSTRPGPAHRPQPTRAPLRCTATRDYQRAPTNLAQQVSAAGLAA